MSYRYVTNAPAVVGEIIDGEAVIMNLQNGQYFNSENSGAVIWGAIEAGASEDGVVEALLARYDVDEPRARASAAQFLQTLIDHQLIRLDSAEPAAVTSFSSEGERAPFAEPTLGVHTDLDDLLMLDPIHDVDEAGWPAPAKRA